MPRHARDDARGRQTRIETTLGEVLQDADQDFLAHASAMAFRESHQTCMACQQILPSGVAVCTRCGIMIPTPRSDADGPGRAFGTVGMVFGGVCILCFGGLIFFLLYNLAHI